MSSDVILEEQRLLSSSPNTDANSTSNTQANDAKNDDRISQTIIINETKSSTTTTTTTAADNISTPMLRLGDDETDRHNTNNNNNNYVMCRICHSDGPVEDLIVPCNCTGSLRYVHQSCLQNWLKINGSKSCEICKEDFIIKVRANALKRWKKPIMTPEHRRKFLLMNFLYIVAILCNLWSINSFSGVLLMQFRLGIYDWKFYMIVFFSLSTFFCIIWFLVSLIQIWFDFCLKCVRFNQSIVIRSKQQQHQQASNKQEI